MKSRWWTACRDLAPLFGVLSVVGCVLLFIGLSFAISDWVADAVGAGRKERQWIQVGIGVLYGLAPLVVLSTVPWFMRLEPSEPPERIKNAIKRRQTKNHDKRGGVSFVASEGGEITEVEQ